MDKFYFYIVVINILTFIVYWLDKRKSRHQKRRIRTNMLLGLAMIGGSLGALLSMYSVRHKTQNPKFVFGIPIILVAHIILLIFLFNQQ